MAKKASRSTNALVSTCGPMPASKPTRAQAEEQRRYRAEDALRTITRAGEVKSDPALMRDVKKLAAEQMKTLKGVMGRK